MPWLCCVITSYSIHYTKLYELAFLLYFRDWRPLIAAAGLIAVHHLLFSYLQAANTGIIVFNSGNGIGLVLLHAVFVVFEAGVLVYMAIKLRSEAVEIAEVAEIRITSYNVCYTKLLRMPLPCRMVRFAFIPV